MANEIQVARELRELTQRQLAERTQVSKSGISRLEGGEVERVAVKDVRAVCVELDLALEAVVPHNTDHQNDVRAQRWIGLIANQLLRRTSWRQLPEALSQCTQDIHFYRPEISGMSMILVDHNRPNHTLFYGCLIEGAQHTINLHPSVVRDKLDSLPPDTGYVEQISGSPEWCAASWRPLWCTHHHSEYGIFTLHNRADPERVGEAVETARRCKRVLEKAIALIYALSDLERDASIIDHEHRLRALESQLRRALEEEAYGLNE